MTRRGGGARLVPGAGLTTARSDSWFSFTERTVVFRREDQRAVGAHPMGREVAGRLTALIEHVESLVPEVERARPATIAGSSGRPGSRQPGQPVAAIR